MATMTPPTPKTIGVFALPQRTFMPNLKMIRDRVKTAEAKGK